MPEIVARDVSIVVPAYAEEQRIGRAVAGLRRLAAGFPRLGEVLLVVEPSGDRTVDAAREAAGGDPLVTILENPDHRGKGFSVRTGMLRAGGEIVFFMDADLSVPLGHVAPFVAHLDAHPETGVVIGNRRHSGSVITRRQHPLRERAGRIFNQAVRALGLSASKDTQCGFKAFRREAAQRIFSRAQIDGFAFDTEILLLAGKLGLRVDELPVEWINDEHTKFRPLRDGWRSVRDLWRLRGMHRRL
ncbi:MAG: glycosyltransferase [Chthoniobacterales bacterium]